MTERKLPYVERIIDGVPYKAYDAAVWINAKQRQMILEQVIETPFEIPRRVQRRKPRRDKEWE